MRRFTVIRGGLADVAPGDAHTMPGRARLETIGARLRMRLEALWQAGPQVGPIRAAAAHPMPIPAQAFLGIRPAALAPGAAPPSCPALLRLVGAVA